MARDFIGFALFLLVLTAVTPLLGTYIARVFGREAGAFERRALGLIGLDGTRAMDWKGYAKALVLFSFASWVVLFAILRTQTLHPWNPNDFHSGSWDLSFNTASSFVTNTNWQFYAGETTLSNFSQMVGLAVQNFVSAGVGLAVAIALVRALAARRTGEGAIGNFWSDLFRSCIYVLLPLSVIAALILGSQGVLQSLDGGPVASQEAIKMLGTNGGGFFNVNSSMPFENPTGFTNILQIFLLMLVPASLTAAYGRMVGRRREGWAIYTAMSALFVVSVVVLYFAERHGAPAQHLAGLHGPNMEGKEVRFGNAGTSLFAAATTVVSCGAVNAAMESLTGLGGLIPMVDMSYSESVFGGVGTGLYTMLMYALLAVFIGGLMVGRTPEYLGKKVEAREIKLVTLATLATPLTVLLGLLVTTATKYGGPSLYASVKPQAFSEQLYAYLSQANNNGSAFAGYTGYLQPEAGNVGAHGVTFADLVGGGAMLAGRYLPILLVLAVAGTLAGKRVAPAGLGTMRTDTGTFVVLLIGVVVLVGALTFLPALLLGPFAQGLTDRVFFIMRLLKDLGGAFAAIIAATVVLGLAYPLVITGIAQVAFGTKADGDPALVQSAPRHPVARYFSPRPSATGWSATATGFSNRGPNSAAAVGFYKSEIARYLKREGRYSPGLTAATIPIDAVTTSASGVDPQISVANAEIQARRIARVRAIPIEKVRALIDAHTSGRFLGLYGDPGVNVDTLNNALDQETR